MMKPFKFKQFTIHQDRCAMKVGTDGVLLGAWSAIDSQPKSILDIGAGTGLIALMLAQRILADTIDALEIEAAAYEQCVENFEASIWADRLFCFHASLAEFIEETEDRYDMIVSNPPFYSEENAGGNPLRDLARQNQFLPYEMLLEGVSKLLSKNGKFSTIIPFTEEESFLDLAKHNGFYPNRVTRVKGNSKVGIKRSLLELGRNNCEFDYDELIIEIKRHKYTPEYIALTRDFYLKL